MTLPPDRTHRGVKRRCEKCSTLFYDMQRQPIQCPQCGTTAKAGSGIGRRLKSVESRARPVRSRVKKPAQTVVTDR